MIEKDLWVRGGEKLLKQKVVDDCPGKRKRPDGIENNLKMLAASRVKGNFKKKRGARRR